MTPEEEEDRTATRAATVHRIMAWTSSNRRMLRWAVFALGAVFVGGIALLFWAPAVGLLVMLIAALPVIVMILIAIAILVRERVATKPMQPKDGP